MEAATLEGKQTLFSKGRYCASKSPSDLLKKPERLVIHSQINAFVKGCDFVVTVEK